MMRKLASITTTTTSLIYFHWYFYIPTSFDSTATNTYTCIINIVSPFLVEVERTKTAMYETVCVYMARSTYSWKRSSPNCQILDNIFHQHLSKDISRLQIQPWLQWVGFPFPFQAPALCWKEWKEVALWWRYLPWRLHRWPKVWGVLWICGIDSDYFRHKPCSLTIFYRDRSPVIQSMMKGGQVSFIWKHNI